MSSISIPNRRNAAARPPPVPSSGVSFVLPALLLILAVFILPVVMLLLRSVTEPDPGLQNYRELFESATVARVFVNTFVVSGLVTAIALLIGFPIAWLLVILPKRWADLLFGIVILSMWTNLLARTYAWMVLLQRTGIINKTLMGLGLIDTPLPLVNNLVGVTIGMTYIMLPFIVLPLVTTMRAIEPDLLRAAALCGAGRWEAFRRVLLPLSLPGIAAGGLLTFVMSLGYFVTPSLLGGAGNMMAAELIAQLVQSLLNWGLGGATAFALLVLTLALYAVQLRLLQRGRSQRGG
ncbi:ABC transporter permease [Azospirillum griseum]|uniref:ABC transporter permease n=1 Tax=Azospirillum griseum TaxID=2496639 RepID=A0A3S0JJ29_9PROT|nr:ABC transporter permease [Azospirillum griseum]RTR21043.1 ABC transporter permease [Azospirillum griseum]